MPVLEELLLYIGASGLPFVRFRSLLLFTFSPGPLFPVEYLSLTISALHIYPRVSPR